MVVVALQFLSALLLAQSVLVEQVLGHAVLWRAHTAQVSHPVGQLFDGLHLLVQVVRLYKITQLGDTGNKNVDRERGIPKGGKWKAEREKGKEGTMNETCFFFVSPYLSTANISSITL